MTTKTDKTELLNNLLILAIEECAEFIHIATKIQRFGLDNHHPNKPELSNVEMIRHEMEDVRLQLEMVDVLLKEMEDE